MNEILLFLIFILTGFVTGIGSGLLGIGGGIIFIPVLYFLLPQIGVSADQLTYVVVATSLFAGSFASGGAFFYHLRTKNISLGKGFYLSAGSVVSAIIIPLVISGINPDFIRYFICFLLIIALVSLQRERKYNPDKKKSLPVWILTISGLFIGAIAALSGTGGGILFFPVLFNFSNLGTKNAIGTSSMAVAITMITATLSFAFNSPPETATYQFGLINYFAGIPMGIGAVAGSRYGVKLNSKLPVPVIKKIFSLFLLLAILKILFK